MSTLRCREARQPDQADVLPDVVMPPCCFGRRFAGGRFVSYGAILVRVMRWRDAAGQLAPSPPECRAQRPDFGGRGVARGPWAARLVRPRGDDDPPAGNMQEERGRGPCAREGDDRPVGSEEGAEPARPRKGRCLKKSWSAPRPNERGPRARRPEAHLDYLRQCGWTRPRGGSPRRVRILTDSPRGSAPARRCRPGSAPPSPDSDRTARSPAVAPCAARAPRPRPHRPWS